MMHLCLLLEEAKRTAGKLTWSANSHGSVNDALSISIGLVTSAHEWIVLNRMNRVSSYPDDLDPSLAPSRARWSAWDTWKKVLGSQGVRNRRHELDQTDDLVSLGATRGP
jgi:hypothetical protein